MSDDSDTDQPHHFRFHLPFAHAFSAYGNNWFGGKAEAFTRFYGTPFFLLMQTSIVILWVAIHLFGFAEFDLYPFVFLNLIFSLQSAYAAPLILLAQMRQADRDNAHAEADAQHKEALALNTQQQQLQANRLSAQLLEMMQQNTQLTTLTKELTERIEALTKDLHTRIVVDGK
jgi:uncharacterized membrane protein